MEADRDLLFGLLALWVRLIEPAQLIAANTMRASRQNLSLPELLIELGWLKSSDKAHVDDLVEQELRKTAADAQAAATVHHEGPPAASADPERTIAPPEVQRSPGDLTQVYGATADLTGLHQPGAEERYTLVRLHATGGIGRVWLALDNDLGREVALKELRPDQAGNAALQARFLKEAQITGQLEHPGIVPVYELVRRPDSQQPFYTMRFIKGRTLCEAARAFHVERQASRFDSLEWSTLLNAFVMVCNTVAYAHSRGVLHRDLKGQNVVLGAFGEVEVLDWGLAKLVDATELVASEASGTAGAVESAETAMTRAGDVIGTPANMAPEQAQGELGQIDHRTDVYGLGSILYEILTGEPPFSGPDAHDVLRRVKEEEPAPPSRLWAEVPAALEAACLRALAKRPADRFAAASELAHEVQQWQELERKQAEDALRASEALYHSLVETIPQMILCKDREGRFTFANRKLCAEFGATLDDIRGKTDYDFFPHELAEKYRREDNTVLESGQTLDIVEEHLTPEGERLYVQVVKTPLFDPAGKTIGIQGVFWNVTEHKRLEDALAGSAAELVRLKEQLETFTGRPPKAT